MLKFKYAEKTDKGIREMNQDSYSVFFNNHGFLVVMVADGMGGHVGGQVASKFAVKTMEAFFKEMNFGIMTDEEIQHQLVKSIHFLSREFKKIGEEKPTFMDMGTTLNLNVFVGDKIFTSNVGDSRSSRVDDTGFMPISEDHNLAQLAKVDKRFAKFAKDTNYLTSSLGPTKETNVDVYMTQLKRSGYLIVTSDGVHQYVAEDFLLEKLQDKKPSLETKVDDIIDEAVRNKTNDNMTIVVVKYGV
jgi:protein phosphatase